jgi:predicted membrane channel-forming protein YqfA (hemolysin III family)
MIRLTNGFTLPEVAAIDKTEKRYHLAGWLLFIICAVFFIAQSLTDNNMLGLSGSIIFFAGCVAFLIPLVSNWRR